MDELVVKHIHFSVRDFTPEYQERLATWLIVEILGGDQAFGHIVQKWADEKRKEEGRRIHDEAMKTSFSRADPNEL